MKSNPRRTKTNAQANERKGRHIQTSLSRREFLIAGAVASTTLGAGLLSAAAGSAPQSRKPNIIVILADDLGYADVGVHGCKDIATPNVDTIAKNGIRFSQGYVSCPICSPTRAGLMTGRYQQRFGHEHNPGPSAYADPKFGLPLSETTLAERLKKLGYVTGMFGKWHLGFRTELQPPKRGFDEFVGFLDGATNYIPTATERRSNPIFRGMEPIKDKVEYTTDTFGAEAVSFIERHRDVPFFVYLPFNAVHSPLQAIQKYLARVQTIKDSKRRTYAAMLTAMDDNIGKVLDAVRRLGIEEQTLIFFLSDNGGPTAETTSSNLPLRGYKTQMWEGGIHLPFMVQWKGHLAVGKVYDKPVFSLDIHPTAVAAAGGTISPDWKLDGVNLLPYLTGENSARPHETMCWRMGDGKHAIRHGDWKMVVERTEPKPQLFNLAEDMREKKDLAATMPDKLKELTELYNTWDAQMDKPHWVRQDARTEEGGRPSRAGRATRAGSQATSESSPAARGGGVEERFKQSDRNGDGKLTPDEFPQESLFKRMDTNGDGVVTLDEARGAFPGRAAGAGQSQGAGAGGARRRAR